MSTAIQTTSAPSSWTFMGDSIDTAGRLAQALVKTGLAPAGMTAGQAFYILLAGKEIGVRGPIEALRHIVVVKGKPTMSAELMRAFMLQAGCKLEWIRQDDKGASLKVTRPDGSVGTFSFLEADAQRAGLLKSGSAWTSYPAAMYAARATSVAARLFCPDMVRGATYTPEELGAAVVVTEDGSEHAALPPAAQSPAPHVAAPPAAEVPAGESATAGAGETDEGALPFDEPEDSLPAAPSGPDSTPEAAPTDPLLTYAEQDKVVAAVSSALGVKLEGSPVNHIVQIEDALKAANAPFSRVPLDKLTVSQGRELVKWARAEGKKVRA